MILITEIERLLKRFNYSAKKPLLLANSPESSKSSSSGVISDYLVTFDDVAELQTRNAQLLQVVRKLSEEQEKWNSSNSLVATGTPTSGRRSSGADEQITAAQSALQSALSELQEMRAARQRTEDMVIGLVQQRDMYRAMVEVSPQGNQ